MLNLPHLPATTWIDPSDVFSSLADEDLLNNFSLLLTIFLFKDIFSHFTQYLGEKAPTLSEVRQIILTCLENYFPNEEHAIASQDTKENLSNQIHEASESCEKRQASCQSNAQQPNCQLILASKVDCMKKFLGLL